MRIWDVFSLLLWREKRTGHVCACVCVFVFVCLIRAIVSRFFYFRRVEVIKVEFRATKEA